MSEKRDITVKSELLLLEYFEVLASNGITQAITQEMFSAVVNELYVKTKSHTSGFVHCVQVDEETFENVVEKANKINYCSPKGIRIEKIQDMLVAIPEYGLKQRDRYLYPVLPFHERKILEEILESRIPKIPPISYSIEKIPYETLSIAKKVAAFFVNDIIKRYVKSRIKQGRWPGQCRDIDEYIFRRNVAKYIDEQGTAELFKTAYIRAICVVADLIEQNENFEIIEISNNPYDLMAHANFLRFIMTEELMFLKEFLHNKYEERDSAITITITKNEVQYRTNTCVFFDPYGDWSDDYKHDKGIITDETVAIMENRIGKIG